MGPFMVFFQMKSSLVQTKRQPPNPQKDGNGDAIQKYGTWTKKSENEKFICLENDILKSQQTRKLVQTIDICTCDGCNPSKLGHHINCYQSDSKCASFLLAFRQWGVHHPKMRTYTHDIYSLKKIEKKLQMIDKAVNDADLTTLQEIRKLNKERSCSTHEHPDVFMQTEEDLKEKHAEGLQNIQKDLQNLPTLECLSCTKLCSRSVVCMSFKVHFGGISFFRK